MLGRPVIHGILNIATGTLVCPTRELSPLAVPLSYRQQITCPQCLTRLARRSRGHGIPEKDLQETIRQAALLHHWKYYHTHDSRNSPEGFPDTVLVRDERLLFAELKRAGNEPTAAQQQWLEALRSVKHVETYLWYPKDIDQALAVLRRLP